MCIVSIRSSALMAKSFFCQNAFSTEIRFTFHKQLMNCFYSKLCICFFQVTLTTVLLLRGCASVNTALNFRFLYFAHTCVCKHSATHSHMLHHEIVHFVLTFFFVFVNPITITHLAKHTSVTLASSVDIFC